jgi:hypothetical protein
VSETCTEVKDNMDADLKIITLYEDKQYLYITLFSQILAFSLRLKHWLFLTLHPTLDCYWSERHNECGLKNDPIIRRQTVFVCNTFLTILRFSFQIKHISYFYIQFKCQSCVWDLYWSERQYGCGLINNPILWRQTVLLYYTFFTILRFSFKIKNISYFYIQFKCQSCVWDLYWSERQYGCGLINNPILWKQTVFVYYTFFNNSVLFI